MSFRGLLTATVAITAGYVAARQLMTDATLQQIGRLPEGARGPLLATRRQLFAARGRASEALQEARAERDVATQELMREYHRATGRTP